MKRTRVPPLTPAQTAKAIRDMQALYGDRALPKIPVPAPADPKPKGKPE